MDCCLPCSSVHGNSPGKNTGVIYHVLRDFPTQGWNQGLLHCKWILYQMSYQGSPSFNTRFSIRIHTSEQRFCLIIDLITICLTVYLMKLLFCVLLPYYMKSNYPYAVASWSWGEMLPIRSIQSSYYLNSRFTPHTHFRVQAFF